LACTAGLPVVVIRPTGTRRREITAGALAAVDVHRKAVLLHTGDDARFGLPQYAAGAHLPHPGRRSLARRPRPALVGIEAVNIDDIADGEWPAHTLLLAAGNPVIEHLTGLDHLPPAGAFFTAEPLRIQGPGTVAEAGGTRQSPMRYVAPPSHAIPGEVHDAGPADEDTPTPPSHPNCPSRVRATATPSGAGQPPQPRRLPENTPDCRQPACSTKHAAPRTAIPRVRNSLRAGTPQAATLHNDPTRARRPAEYGRLVVGSTRWIDGYVTTVSALFGQVGVEHLPKCW
jgi:hypothetical protein